MEFRTKFAVEQNCFLLIIIISIVPTGCQLTLLGSKEVIPEDIWGEALLHFPMIGKTYYFQYDIFIKEFVRKKIAAIQLEPDYVKTYIAPRYVYYEVKGAKSMKNKFPGKDYLHKWLKITVWTQIFQGNYSTGIAADGQLLDLQNGIADGEEIKDAEVLMSHGGAHIGARPPCTVRSVSVFGPQHINLQLPEVTTDVVPKAIVITTEFYSSGEDYYELFPIENTRRPLEMATSLTFDIENLGNENVKKDVVLEEILNEFGMPVKLKHKIFTEMNVTEKQSYTLPVIFGNVNGKQIHLAYVHNNPEYELIDITTQAVRSFPKKCGHLDLKVSFTASRSRSSTRLDIHMAPPKTDCNDDLHDITFLVYHQKDLVPFHIDPANVKCMNAKSTKIHKHYVQIYFDKLFIGAKICLSIRYDVSSAMDVSELLSGVVKVKYKTMEKGIYKTITAKYSGQLEEFPGYYIRNVEKGCCLAIKSELLHLQCTLDKSSCIKVKQRDNAFITDKGCFTAKPALASQIMLSPCTYTAHQMFNWDNTDISVDTESKEKKSFLKIDEDMNLKLISAKRKCTFRKITINSQNKPVQCYIKDKMFNGVTMAILENIASWEKCSIECRSRKTCMAWSWFSPHHNPINLRLKCVLKSSVMKDRGMMWQFLSGSVSGYNSCMRKAKVASSATSPADVSILVLNNKLYFCAYIHNNLRSTCYRHEMDHYAVTRIASSMVSILGGHLYSNTIYGQNSQGQVIKFNMQDTSFTLLSKAMFENIQSKDFVRAKSYNRTKLFYKTLYSEVFIQGKWYGITYYGIYDESRKTHLVVWLPDNECNHRVASREDLALKACPEVDSYCEHSVSGFYWLRKPLPFNITKVWCELEGKEERYTAVEEEPVQVKREPIMSIPQLSKGYRIEFELNIREVDPRMGSKENRNHIFEIKSGDNNLVVGMALTTDKDHFKNKLHFMVFGFAKMVQTSANYATWESAEQVSLLLGKAWNNVTLIKYIVGVNKYQVDAFLNNKKVIDNKPVENSPVFNNVIVTTGYRVAENHLIPKNAYLRNFYIYTKYEKEYQ